MAEKRAGNFAKRVSAFLDREFFTRAVADGTEFNPNGLTAVKDIVDAMIVEAKSVESDFIDGIDAEDLALVLSPAYRKALKNELDDLPQGTVAANGLIGRYDGVDVYESHRIGTNVHAIIMLKGAIAQPFFVSEYAVEKIPLYDGFALQTFLYKGDGVLAPEAVIYHNTGGSY